MRPLAASMSFIVPGGMASSSATARWSTPVRCGLDAPASLGCVAMPRVALAGPPRCRWGGRLQGDSLLAAPAQFKASDRPTAAGEDRISPLDLARRRRRWARSRPWAWQRSAPRLRRSFARRVPTPHDAAGDAPAHDTVRDPRLRRRAPRGSPRRAVVARRSSAEGSCRRVHRRPLRRRTREARRWLHDRARGIRRAPMGLPLRGLPRPRGAALPAARLGVVGVRAMRRRRVPAVRSRLLGPRCLRGARRRVRGLHAPPRAAAATILPA